MARQTRSILAKIPHYVTTRGVAQAPVFTDDEDRAAYLGFLKRSADATKASIHAYVLIPNQVHLLASGEEDGSLSQMMQQLGRFYVRWYNQRHARSGTLWEGRFRASAIEAQTYLFECMRHIERYPVRAGLATHPEEYAWSSYRHHSGAAFSAVVSDHFMYWELGNTPFEREAAYKKQLAADAPKELSKQLAARCHAGRPLGSDRFLRQLEAQLGRSLEPKKPGRPKRVSTADEEPRRRDRPKVPQ